MFKVAPHGAPIPCVYRIWRSLPHRVIGSPVVPSVVRPHSCRVSMRCVGVYASRTFSRCLCFVIFLVHSSYHVLPTFFAVPNIHIFAPSHMSTVHAMSACCSLLLFHAVQGAYSFSKFVCVLFLAGPGPIKQILPPSPQQFACICCRLSRIWPSGCPRMLQFRGGTS